MDDLMEIMNRNLELVIMPTEACNLRCEYCYEHFEIGQMEPKLVNSLKLFFGRRLPELERFKISWFGGEPLLAYPIMVELLEHAWRIAESQNPGLKFTSDATTNATLLTTERLAKLTSLGVKSYQVSFDGDKDEHDKLRVTAGRKGTFDLIWGNLLSAHDTNLDFRIVVRVHANKNNEGSIGRLIDRIGSEFEADRRFVMFIRHLSRLGGPNDASLPVVDDSGSVDRLRERAGKLGLRMQVLDEDYVCYASRPNAYVIRADGTISKCTVALYSQNNIVGVMNTDGTMALNSEKILPWSRGVFSGDRKELACPMKGFPKDGAQSGLLRLRAMDDVTSKLVDGRAAPLSKVRA